MILIVDVNLNERYLIEDCKENRELLEAITKEREEYCSNYPFESKTPVQDQEASELPLHHKLEEIFLNEAEQIDNEDQIVDCTACYLYHSEF